MEWSKALMITVIIRKITAILGIAALPALSSTVTLLQAIVEQLEHDVSVADLFSVSCFNQSHMSTTEDPCTPQPLYIPVLFASFSPKIYWNLTIYDGNAATFMLTIKGYVRWNALVGRVGFWRRILAGTRC